jgi:signal transduction histidine kinase/DNA-binding response OmpR family regulator
LNSKKSLLVLDSLIIDTKTNTPTLNLFQLIPEMRTVVSRLRSWFIDKNQNLWIGTAMGLHKISIQRQKFQRYLFNGNDASKGISCRGILPQPDGTLVVNTEFAGQFEINPRENSVRQLIKPSSLTNLLYGLVRDSAGAMLYFYNEGLLIKNFPNGLEKKYQWDRNSAWTIYFTDKSHFWAGSTHKRGIMPGDYNKPDYKGNISYNGFDELKTSSVFHIGSSASGAIWICSESGLYKANKQKGIIERYWSGGKGNHYFPTDYILHFYEDKDGIFWLASSGRGLIKWNPKTGESIYFTKNKGLLVETVYAVYEDNKNFLWLPTDFGIIQFDKLKEEVKHIFTTEDGLSNLEFNRISHARGLDSTLYFGGINGITAFKPNDLASAANCKKAPLQIVSCAKFDGELGQMVDVTNDLIKTNRLSLNPNDRYISLTLALLSYSHTKAIQYFYRFDKEPNWKSQFSPELNLGALPFGLSKIHIKAQAANGEWAANELTLEITQLRPIYLRPWFIALILILLVFGFIVALRFRTRQLLVRQRIIENEIQMATKQLSEQAEELRKLDSLKSRFFANVSHELRTPLTLILGPLTTLNNLTEDNKNKLVKTALTQTKQLLKLVNELLDFSKLESGKMKLQNNPVDFNAFIQRVYSTFESYAQSLEINFRLQFNPDKSHNLLLDIDKVTKILNNLIANAIKFTNPGGSVTLIVEEVDDKILISIKDTGRGISREDLPHIFERFYQTNQTDLPLEGGSGIGLSICREFAELMNAELWAESKPNQGSTFFFRFVKTETSLNNNVEIPDEIFEGEPDSTNEKINSGQGPKPLILLVEDNESLRTYIQQLLSEYYEVHTEVNGEKALVWLNNAFLLPSLIVSDVMMPVMDGFQLLERVKAQSKFNRIPFVILTARADIKDKLQALRIGVDDYMIKPFEEEELLARIENLLGNFFRKSKALEAPIGTEPPENNHQAEPAFSLNDFSNHDSNWLIELENLVAKLLPDQNLTTDELAKRSGMSRSNFLRQVKRQTGLTPSQYLDEARYAKARYLLETNQVKSVKEASHRVGLLQVEHFSRSFKKRYGKYPSEYLIG